MQLQLEYNFSLTTISLFLYFAAKPHRSTENKVHSQHLMFVVCYVTFRAAYSLAVTFTVLLLLIRFVNR